MVVYYPDQTSTDQQRQCVLHGATREAGGDGDATVAGACATALRAVGFRPQMQINEKCRRSAVVSGEIAHEHIHYIVIETKISPHAHIVL